MSHSGPLKYPGGKAPLAAKLHDLAAPYKQRKDFLQGWLHRVIPFAGGLGEFWTWECADCSEVVNDLDGRLTDFYATLRDEKEYDRFLRLCEVTPFSQQLWDEARTFFDQPPSQFRQYDMAQRAWYFFILVRQSLAGRMKTFAPLTKRRLRRGMNEQASAWWNAVDGLGEAHERLKRVVILNEDGLVVCRREDGPNTLTYMDCPYLPETRTAPKVYLYEMDEIQHIALLDWAVKAKGWVMISGYASPLYDSRLKGWARHTFDVPNHAAGGPMKRRMTEVCWTNFNLKDQPNAQASSGEAG